MKSTQELDAFVQRIVEASRPPLPMKPVAPTTEARIALLKIALDQFLLTPGMERIVGQDVWKFAQNVREDC